VNGAFRRIPRPWGTPFSYDGIIQLRSGDMRKKYAQEWIGFGQIVCGVGAGEVTSRTPYPSPACGRGVSIAAHGEQSITNGQRINIAKLYPARRI
jgi:hypothetical protein